MWFSTVFGFEETNAQVVREHLLLEGETLTSLANGKQFRCGRLEIASMAELSSQAEALNVPAGKLSVNEIVNNVRFLHTYKENAHALFQAASQFNLLEMAGPHVTPEKGVDGYSFDNTQGPACAIACGAGTVYRNYFVEVNGRCGQTADNQIDCLDLVAKELNSDKEQYWKIKNGYALFQHEGMNRLYDKLQSMTDDKKQRIRELLKVGVQWDTEVTQTGAGHTVTQVYCSALPVRYCNVQPDWFEPFARLILESLYASTLHAGLINYAKTGCNKVFLTLVGGGTFGNKSTWITESMLKVFRAYNHYPLKVSIVSYQNLQPPVQSMLAEFRANNSMH